MLNADLFGASLDNHVNESRKDSPDGTASVTVQLYTGARYQVSSVAEVGEGWVALDVYEDKKIAGPE